MKYLKITIGIISIIIISVSIYLFSNKKDDIKTILKGESYAYLSDNAKEYIEKVYEETGELILTEKNKEKNLPYLNPQYIQYLDLPEEEKTNTELIPEVYTLDYISNEKFSEDNSLPKTYDLRNLNNKNYISPMKNQGNLGICWAIASIENAETFVMYQNKESYNNSSQIFSARQMDYATSTDGMMKKRISSTSYYNYPNDNNGSRKLTKSGNFYISSIIMSNGLSLTDEEMLPWNESTEILYSKDILNYNNSKYEVDSTIQMPQINIDTAPQELITNYTNEIKNYIMQYGGPVVGTYSPESTCGFTNIDGNPTLKTDDCVSINASLGHAMQIVGWDDNYQYAYCDAGTRHYSTINGSCNTGTYTEGNGAWILRNSWGEDSEYKYVYLTYDSTRVSISFITSMTEIEERAWNNNYHTNPWINKDFTNGMTTTKSQTVEFKSNNKKAERIEKIKFFPSSMNGTYNLSIISENKKYNNIATAKINEIGIYTFDLSDKNILLNDSEFTIKIEGNNEATFFNDTISIFTSNIDDEESATTYSENAHDSDKPLSENNPLYVSGDNYWHLNIESYLKNIPEYSELTYRLKKDNTIETEFAELEINSVENKVEASFNGSINTTYGNFNINNAYGETYTFEILYNDNVIDSFPIKFSGKGKTTKSTIKLYANNYTNNYYVYEANDKKTNILKSNGMNNINFFNDGYYIESWNTKRDGTGTSYKVDDEVYIYHDMILYAQWSSTQLSAQITYNCANSDQCTGSINSTTLKYNEKLTLPQNTFKKDDDSEFLHWELTINNLKYIYYEQETISETLSEIIDNQVFNNPEIKIYATWSNDYKTITFNANGGSGTMNSIKIEPYLQNNELKRNRLKYNLFSKKDYKFKEWNTKADGTGAVYSDGQLITTDKDITLYAIWEKADKYKINNYSYDDKNQYISKIMVNTTVDSYKQNIELHSEYRIDVEFKTIDNKNLIYTGSKTKIYKEQILDTEFTNIVIGDINGDAAINSADLLRIRQHLIGSNILSGVYLIASNINYDSDINSADLLRIRQHLLGTKPING